MLQFLKMIYPHCIIFKRKEGYTTVLLYDGVQETDGASRLCCDHHSPHPHHGHCVRVQRGFAQKICRSYRSVSLNASLLLSGLLPLTMRVEEAALLYEIKRGKPFPYIAGRPVENKTCFLNAAHPADNLSVTFNCIEDWTAETLTAKGIGGYLAFTDGSKSDGKVGAAVSWWRDGKEVKSKKLKLEPYCSVFQAEMLALHYVTSQALHDNDKKITIFSDSRSALELLQCYETFHPLAFEIRGNLIKLVGQGKTIELFWVKAHVGIEGNERADELAKEAALKLRTAAHYEKCPISFVKKIIRHDTIKKWELKYANEKTAKTTKQFFPTLQMAYQTLKKIKLTQELVQAFTGHGGFAKYLHTRNIKPSFGCICDPMEPETSIHVVVDCPANIVKRSLLEIQFGRNIQRDNLSEWLLDDRLEKAS